MSARKILACLALGCCLITVVSSALYFHNAHQLALANTHHQIEQRSKLLATEFNTFLANNQGAIKAISTLPQLIEIASNPTDQTTSGAIAVLNNVCTAMNASVCYVLDKDGITLVENSNSPQASFVGENYAFRPYYQNARDDGQAVYLALGTTPPHKLGIYISSKIRSKSGDFLGVFVVKLPAKHLDNRFINNQDNGTTVLIDPNGVVFASTRPEWRLKSLWQLSEQQNQTLLDSRQFGDHAIDSVGFTQVSETKVLSANGAEYLIGTDTTPLLPQWKLVYLKDVNVVAFGFSANNSEILGFITFFILTVLAVISMYRVGSADLNKRRKAEEALKQSENRLRQLIDITNEAIIIHHEGRITDANKMAEKMFGYNKETLKTYLLWELLDPQCISKARNHYLEHDELPYEINAMHNDGRTFPIEIYVKKAFIQDRYLNVTCIRDISERKETERRIRHQAHFDSLTELPNRNLMVDRLNQAIKKAHRQQINTVVMFIDLDDFKKINDSLGHTTGDQLLVAASKRLQASTREGDTLSRYGGDEFVMILEDIDNLEEVEIVAEKMLRALSQEFIIGEHSFYISGSIGISMYPDDGNNVDQLLQKADTAMYCSKDEGRNTYHFYTPSMNEHVHERLTIERHLRTALDNNELYLHYQPIFCTTSGKLLGAEALLRWKNQDLGLVGPDRFIPTAEQTGLIVPIGEWVVEQVCAQIRRWLDLGVNDFRVSINIPPRQFKDQNLLKIIKRSLATNHVPGSALAIEITEGLLIKNDQRTAQTLTELKALDIHLSLDDFGTGYSALSYL